MAAVQALDHEGRRSQASAERPIDLVHLTRMTLGERTLEREVLQLFVRQAENLLTQMRVADPGLVTALAHRLKGSARGIGAWRAARAAEAMEAAAAGEEARRNLAAQELEAAIQEAGAFVRELLPAN